MDQLFIYLLKSGGLIAVFYLAYHFLVRKETFFNTNRWFLLSGLLTSIVLPLYFFKKIIWIAKPKASVQEFPVFQSQQLQPIQNTPIVEAIDWMQLIWISYGIIAAILIIKIAFNMASLYRMLHKKNVTLKGELILIELDENIAPFSFFNYIVYNPDLYSNEELKSILLHEQIHSRQKHSADVLIAELFCCVFWFNPFMWFYKKAITQNLEYIADQKAIAQLEDKKSYQHALLKVVSNQNGLPITNNFYQSLIKKRIVMLNKNQSQKKNSWKYAMVIPALIGFVFLFQIKVVAQEKEIQNVKTELMIVYYILEKNSTDKEISEDVKSLKKDFNIEYSISDIKRNSDNEIVAISVDISQNDGQKYSLHQKTTKPITPIKFGCYINNLGEGQISFYGKVINNIEINHEVKDDKIAISKEKKENYWTINNLKENGRSVLIIIDGVKQNNKRPIEISNDREIDQIIKLTKIKDSDRLSKYGQEGKYGVVLVTTKIIGETKVASTNNFIKKLIIINGQIADEKTFYDLDPNLIEKVEVLEDKESIEKIGAKGKNGVIIVTTKKNESNRIEDEKVRNGLYYQANPPKNSYSSKTRIIVTREHRLPLVIEDGRVIEGGTDYSKEEIDEILKRNEKSIDGEGGFKLFNYKGSKDFSKGSGKIQKQLEILEQEK
ncbi:M56 family metallopeptidase [Flavobacterium sp.]|uniref:M56 family metallopeptidase n=1 Tax=Flavobacterium sp. TaxID=239 RepID=UPI002488F543|nr:M56 family metallopeptidase [Flavobacterium sp.]MDI1317891.1 M56 family metallopeptidase [Flavobacterium sp.]